MSSYETDSGLGGHTGHRQLVEYSRRNWRVELRIWWNEIDRLLLLLVALLMAIGAVAVAVASPASAERLSTNATQLPELYFYWAHLRFLALGVLVMLGLSTFSRDGARRFGILLAVAMLVAMFLVPLAGAEVKGSRRWIDIGIRFQPSESLKPAFAILMAWILSWKVREPDLPVMWLAAGLMLLVASLLMLQPNLGDTVLFLGVWVVLVFLSGQPMKFMVLLGGAGLATIGAAYLFYDNARNRIDSFFSGGTAFDQVDLAQRTLLNGGWTGTGIRLGVRKFNLPEAHNDYIFSVIGEEFGLIVCAIVVMLYLAIAVRVLWRLSNEEDLFALLAGAGLVSFFCGQAFINMLVNLQLFPSKGMTLPLISYGGTSTIAICVTLGLLLATTRRNPFLERHAPDIWTAWPSKEKRA